MPKKQVSVAEVNSGGQALVEAVVSDVQQGRDLVNQLLGQVQMADAVAKFTATVAVTKMAFVKENKLYQGLSGMLDRDGRALSGTWEEFCKLLGTSAPKVNEDITNLQAFGELALESMTRMGIGYREMRQFRRLPEDQKTALIEMAQGGSKDDLLELAEELLEKERAAKDELAAQNADLTTRANVLERELEKTGSEFKRFKDRAARQPGKAVFADRTGFVREEALAYQLEGQLAVDALTKLFQEVVQEPDRDDPEWKARFEMVWIQGQALYARTLLMVEAMREAGGMGFAPLGNHVLTAEEASAWLADVELITRQQEAQKQQRELAREAAKPRGPGRPAGSGKKQKGAE